MGSRRQVYVNVIVLLLSNDPADMGTSITVVNNAYNSVLLNHYPPHFICMIIPLLSL